MADDKLQDDDLVKTLLRNQDRLATERSPWESLWQEIDERVNPLGAGGFTKSNTSGYGGQVRGASNFDVTAVESLDKFTAAMSAISIPLGSQYIRVKFGDKYLDSIPAVRRWCEHASQRLYAIRYAPQRNFQVQALEDFRQLGSYGTGPLWSGVRPGFGPFYKALHLSECYIDEDFTGRIDTVHRKYELDARQCAQEFGRDALTGKMHDALQNQKLDMKFEILHAVRPNADRVDGALDRRAMPVDSITIAIGEKAIVRRGGFHSMPISVSRHITGPGDKYGRSPALKVLPTIRGLNTMKRTILRMAHKQADPALAFYDEEVTGLITRPGGANPGLVDENGRLLVAKMPGGEGSLPVGMEMIDQEREVVKAAFLEDYWKLLTDDTVQRSATAVLEIAAKTGSLVAPYAARYESEKQNPVTMRDLELAMRAGQIEPFPPEVLEAGAYPEVAYENPLSRMARAQEASALTRWIETMTPLAQLDDGAVFDHIDTDNAAPGLGEVLGVNADWIATPEAVAAKRKAREDSKAAAAGVEQLQGAASAYKDIANGNQIAAQAA